MTSIALQRLALLALFAAGLSAPAMAQVPRGYEEGRPALDARRGSVFKCDGAHDLVAQFDSRGAEQIAIVDAGDGPHVLPLTPWRTGDEPKITWSDGARSLTWTPGVKLMWMDGSIHRMCGRGGEHQH